MSEVIDFYTLSIGAILGNSVRGRSASPPVS